MFILADITYRPDQFPYANLVLVRNGEILFDGKFLPVCLLGRDPYELDIRAIWEYRGEIHEDVKLTSMFQEHTSIVKNLIGARTYVNVGPYRIDMGEDYLFITRRYI